ncbi:MAG TPA: DUF4337 family protein [Roseiarcus sp.]|jgi:hypothetical protein|nr:DUF4337 family protein [Roseiarcus sp.]
MPEPTESAVEAKEKDRKVALIIAVLALLLALSEAGAKAAQHLSTEKNIEASDLFNFYEAKKIRSTIVETASKILQAQKAAIADAGAQDAFEKQIGDFKTIVARFEKDTQKPEDSLDAIEERAKAAVEARELANRKLDHYEISSGLSQIAIVLASAAIITGISALVWLSVSLGVVAAIFFALGFLAPGVLTILG